MSVPCVGAVGAAGTGACRRAGRSSAETLSGGSGLKSSTCCASAVGGASCAIARLKTWAGEASWGSIRSSAALAANPVATTPTTVARNSAGARFMTRSLRSSR